jgi:hypothetical protein
MLDNAALKESPGKKMVTLAAEREAWLTCVLRSAFCVLRSAFDMSERRACRVIGCVRFQVNHKRLFRVYREELLIRRHTHHRRPTGQTSGRNLQPTVRIGTAQIAAKNDAIRPLDRLPNGDPKTSPRLPWVQQRPHSAIGDRIPLPQTIGLGTMPRRLIGRKFSLRAV